MGWIFHNRKNKDGTQSIIYQVYYDGLMFPITTGVKAKKVKPFNGRIKGDIKGTFKLQAIESIILRSLQDAKSQIPHLTCDQVKARINLLMQGHTLQEGKVRVTLYDYWGNRITEHKRAKRVDSAEHHENSRKAVFKVIDREIFIDELSRNHLRLISEQLQEGRSTSTINGYFRDLRSIINIALADQLITINPFLGFKAPAMKPRKLVALTLEELQAFAKVKVRSKNQELVRDMAMFRYYCLGMRIKDQLLLTPKNLQGDILHYITSKTKKEFYFTLPPHSKKLVDKWKNNSRLFPVLKLGLTAAEEKREISNIRKAHRQALNKIAKAAGINKVIGTHTFRHSFNFINDHLTIAERQTGLGHSSITTTEKYNKKNPDLDNLVNQTKR